MTTVSEIAPDLFSGRETGTFYISDGLVSARWLMRSGYLLRLPRNVTTWPRRAATKR